MTSQYQTLGAPVFDSKFHFVVITYPREIATRCGATDTAPHTEAVFGFPEGSVGVWYGLDKASDFSQRDVSGLYAYNVAILSKILPCFENNSNAHILVVMEVTFHWCDNVNFGFYPSSTT